MSGGAIWHFPDGYSCAMERWPQRPAPPTPFPRWLSADGASQSEAAKKLTLLNLLEPVLTTGKTTLRLLTILTVLRFPARSAQTLRSLPQPVNCRSGWHCLPLRTCLRLRRWTPRVSRCPTSEPASRPPAAALSCRLADRHPCCRIPICLSTRTWDALPCSRCRRETAVRFTPLWWTGWMRRRSPGREGHRLFRVHRLQAASKLRLPLHQQMKPLLLALPETQPLEEPRWGIESLM